MTYHPPQQPGGQPPYPPYQQYPPGYAVPQPQAVPVPPRPPAVLTAAVLMFTAGFVGLLMLGADLFRLIGGHGFNGASFSGIVGCLGPLSQLALGVLAVFVVKGDHRVRGAAVGLAGTAGVINLLNAAFALYIGLDYADTVPVVYGLLTMVLAAACATALILLATGAGARWFAALRDASRNRWYPAR
ncbi:hypothetical protein Afil01_19770 [Actinorhabdospora filicis]|uniref:Uncharacterized protein n=1 Tax=Actinorhabdospora filicis TaxID=1785913 RepID=A0A9W6SHE3_9ACTN|nr:hypothetical protein [Actinorhabdospora filicis]GLZ77170.1 hypothetical protein Afil01_19770 [Actinorhabdospora filicis]